MSTCMMQVSGTLLIASPPSILPRLMLGRSKKSLTLAGERHGLDAAEDVVGLEHGVVAEPRGRSVRGGAADGEAEREHALGLHADVKVGRLAGDREVAAVAALDQNVGAADAHRLGLFVGDAEEADLHPFLVAQIAQRAHHRGERGLHVVGAATDQVVALDARLELAGLAGDDVDVAVEDEHRAGALVLVISTGSPATSISSISKPLDSSQPLMKLTPVVIPSGVDVSYAIRRLARSVRPSRSGYRRQTASA